MVYLTLIIISGMVLSSPISGSGPFDPAVPVSNEVSRQNAPEEIKAVILEKAKEVLKSSFDSKSHRFRLSVRWIPQKVLRLEPDQIIAVELQGRIERYTNFQVICQARGTRHEVQVQLAVKMEQKVPVTNRRITGGEIVQKEDFSYRWASITKIDGRLVSEMDRLAGKTVRRTLLPGQPIRKSDVSTEYLIEAGDIVTLIFEKKGISVKLTGEARQSGAKDEGIKIYSNETRRKYLGKVISPGVVKWKKTL